MTELLIVFVVNDNVQLMDIAGPADVFSEANTLYGQPIYRSILVAPQKTIRSSCGFVMQADYCLEDINALSIDRLLVAGAPNAARSVPAQGVIQWLSHTAPQARRFTKLWPTITTVAGMVASVGLLAVAMKSLPLGTVYTVWTGIGGVGAFVVGVMFLGEMLSFTKILAAGFILCGLILMKMGK
ncbi:SMR family transporter [Acetobacter syzygii]|uniref:Guanidinium exporter n=1 Tax=Acetobacter syzygii TaxID=146476 RepID=A0A270BG60_9PROT|nr:SMR family transporter [Acetobacter syzygii]PAL24002.1 hypothetical protein B9K05_09525 [Acetobacter syzygii]PAL24721.1 hypothetical protein B9K04_09015 [Acetobacter syzygii]